MYFRQSEVGVAWIPGLDVDMADAGLVEHVVDAGVG
jgi:hypothetical protein